MAPGTGGGAVVVVGGTAVVVVGAIVVVVDGAVVVVSLEAACDDRRVVSGSGSRLPATAIATNPAPAATSAGLLLLATRCA